jgi:hypothetical protein
VPREVFAGGGVRTPAASFIDQIGLFFVNQLISKGRGKFFGEFFGKCFKLCKMLSALDIEVVFIIFLNGCNKIQKAFV